MPCVRAKRAAKLGKEPEKSSCPSYVCKVDGCGTQADGRPAGLRHLHCALCSQPYDDCLCNSCADGGGPCACLTNVVKNVHIIRHVCPAHYGGKLCTLGGKDAQYCHGVRPRALCCLGPQCTTSCQRLWVQLRQAVRDADGALRVRQCNDIELLEEFSQKATGEWIRTCDKVTIKRRKSRALAEAAALDGTAAPRAGAPRKAGHKRSAAALEAPPSPRPAARPRRTGRAAAGSAPRAAPRAGAALATGGAGGTAWAAAPADHANAPAPPELTWDSQDNGAVSVAAPERAGIGRLPLTAVLGMSGRAVLEADATGVPVLDANLTRTDTDDVYISLLLSEDPPHESYAAHAYDAVGPSTVAWGAALDSFPRWIPALNPKEWMLAKDAEMKQRAGALLLERPDSGGSTLVHWAPSAGAGA